MKHCAYTLHTMRHTTFNIMLPFVFLLLICKFEYCYSNNVACFERERDALLRFKESLIDKSNRLSSWTGLDCCKWEGISCSLTTGHVLKLDLHNTIADDHFQNGYYSGLPANYSNSCLGGEINLSLVNLAHLNYLDLSLNNFSGIQVPKFLGSFKNLRYLNLGSSNFVGNIPTNLGNLSSLEHLNLGTSLGYPISNYLTSDNLNWLANLSSLKSLDMPGISICCDENWLSTINNLMSLSSLNLKNCGLNTTNPPSHVNSTSLTSLDLSGNSLDSTIFPWLSNLTRLEHLNLFGNQFIGRQILLCKLHNLVSLDLGANHFNGLIPDCLGNLTSLTSLSLRGNSFTGSIPNNLSHLCSLQFLDVSENKLTGSIRVPSNCPFYRLKDLILHDNNFKGELPDWLYKNKNLETLSLYSNSFSGPIVDSIGNLSMLNGLFIGGNKFTGSVPSSIGKLSNLNPIFQNLVSSAN
ncbi:receptor-like protein EIX2 [Ipomoea triloba]|uniref:receptor-like protein EIX2 n=1 Tax=Ipomoea triloba TaxID=35885 RepID=UPI00125E72DB|nr:receptor-like protein EIX2 [Ipomoea triloba]